MEDLVKAFPDGKMRFIYRIKDVDIRRAAAFDAVCKHFHLDDIDSEMAANMGVDVNKIPQPKIRAPPKSVEPNSAPQKPGIRNSEIPTIVGNSDAHQLYLDIMGLEDTSPSMPPEMYARVAALFGISIEEATAMGNAMAELPREIGFAREKAEREAAKRAAKEAKKAQKTLPDAEGWTTLHPTRGKGKKADVEQSPKPKETAAEALAKFYAERTDGSQEPDAQEALLDAARSDFILEANEGLFQTDRVAYGILEGNFYKKFDLYLGYLSLSNEGKTRAEIEQIHEDALNSDLPDARAILKETGEEPTNIAPPQYTDTPSQKTSTGEKVVVPSQAPFRGE